MAVMTLSLLYKSYFTMSEIVYPFWFYSGVVASKVYALRQESRLRRSAATAPGPFRTGWREAAPVSYRR